MNNILIRLIKETENELATIREKASMYRDSSPGRDVVMVEVDCLEVRLAQLHEHDSVIKMMLASHGVETIRDLYELRKTHESTTIATGNRIWQELLFIRGLGKSGKGDRTRWLPSDLIKVEGFPDLEAQARKEIEAATKALPSVIADLKSIEGLIMEAQANGSS